MKFQGFIDIMKEIRRGPRSVSEITHELERDVAAVRSSLNLMAENGIARVTVKKNAQGNDVKFYEIHPAWKGKARLDYE